MLVGTKIGQGMVDCVAAWKVKNPNVLVMRGDPTDNNATLFKKGAHSVIDGSGFKVAKEYDTPDWSADWLHREATALQAIRTAQAKFGKGKPVTPEQMRWGIEHLRYRLRGTTDERTAEVLRVARELISRVPARGLERMNPEVMAAILPRVYPQMLDEVYAHQDAGRATFIVSAAGNGVVEPLAAVLGMG